VIFEIRDLVRRHGQIPLKELCGQLHIPPDTARAILNKLIRKGQVEKLPPRTPCAGGCRLCPPETVEIYRWVSPNPDISPAGFGPPDK